MIRGTLITVTASKMPVVASRTFRTFAGLIVAFGLAGMFADLAVEFDHGVTLLVRQDASLAGAGIPFL